MDRDAGSIGRGEGGDPLLGQIVANYRVMRLIGQGGMGAVYLAQHMVLGREAAIKVLLPEMSNNRELVGRFLTEARATAQLRHPGFVEIFDSGALPNGSGYLVMEYLRGASLAAALQWRTMLEASEILEVLHQVAVSVAHAHKHGIVHRDLKPDNVFVALEEDAGNGDHAVIKVLDFGIAKLMGASSAEASRTRTGFLLGTPLYMSPEQCRGAGYVDHRADIYALGCIAYQALTGRPPFALQGFGEIIAAHLNQAPVPPRALVPSVPPGVDRFVLSLLEKDPGRRPQTMDAVVATVAELRRADGGPAIDVRTLIPPAGWERPPSPIPPVSVVLTPSPAWPSPAAGAVSPAAWPGPATPPPAGWQPRPAPAGSGASSRPRQTVPVGTVPRGLPSISTLAGAASEVRSQPGLQGFRGSPARSARIAVAVVAGLGVCAGLAIVLGGLGTHSAPPWLASKRNRSFEESQPSPSSGERTVSRPAASGSTDPSGAADPAGDPEIVAPERPARSPQTRPVALPPASATVTLKIASNPSGAVVLDSKGRVIGQTPLERALPRRNGQLGFFVRKPGYHPKHVLIDASSDSSARVTLERRLSGGPRTSDDGDDDRRKL